MKAILIHSANSAVVEVDFDGFKDLQALVGGYIEAARAWDSGDVLFVDEEGLLKPQRHFFRIDGRDEPLAGNGVIVGPERSDVDGKFLGNDAPSLTVAQVAAMVRFMDRAQVDAWGKANASEPAQFITTPEETVVLGRYGELIANMPRPEDEAAT